MLHLKNILKVLPIIIGAFAALILTRLGISYLLLLVALGFILPFLTKDKKSAVLSGILYAAISYIISYPSGLFLSNYMPSIEIPINVSPIEVIFNLLLGLLVPMIVAAIICFITAIIGEYLSNKIQHKDKKEKEYHFQQNNENKIQYDEGFEEITPYDRKNLLDLTSIQKAKNKRKNKENK